MNLFPGLPDDLGLECLIRLDYKFYQNACKVCHRWHELLRSKEFYYLRKERKCTHQVACLVQRHRRSIMSGCNVIDIYDPVYQRWARLNEIGKYKIGLPFRCKVASYDDKLVVVGGFVCSRLVDVFVYDLLNRTWKQGRNMPSKRSQFAIGALNGEIYIAGGHDENNNALKSAWRYDLKIDDWNELTPMSQERDACEGIVIGNEFWVVGGYTDENRWLFEESAESYQPETGIWRRVEGAWKASQCPESSVGVGEDGKLICWAESNSAVKVMTCAVQLGDWTLVTGKPSLCELTKYFMVKGKEKNSEFTRINVPGKFESNYTTSGCAVEI